MSDRPTTYSTPYSYSHYQPYDSKLPFVTPKLRSLPHSGDSREWQLLTLSADSPRLLKDAAKALAVYLKENPHLNLADVAYTLQMIQKPRAHRLMTVCRHFEEAIRFLESPGTSPVFIGETTTSCRPIVFLFPGGSLLRKPNTAREFYESEPVFRDTIDTCADILKPHLGCDIRNILYPAPSQANGVIAQLQRIAVSIPLIFILEYALAKLWLSWGIKPEVMLGYSLGEYVAACLADVIALPDLLPIVALGGRLLATIPPLKFLNIALPEEKLKPLLGKELSLVAVNGPSLCLVGGPDKATAGIKQRLQRENVAMDYLHVGIASHTRFVEAFLKDYIEFGRHIPLQTPGIPYLSGLTGTWARGEDTSNISYWGKVMRHTVRFADTVSHLLQDPNRILLELGPGATLTTLVNRHPHKSQQLEGLNSVHLATNRIRSDTKLALTSLGQLWLAGAKVDWRAFYAGQRRYQVSLPYPLFESGMAS